MHTSRIYLAVAAKQLVIETLPEVDVTARHKWHVGQWLQCYTRAMEIIRQEGGHGLKRRSGACLKLSVVFSPDLVALLEQEIKAGERAVTAAMKSAGAELKQDWREQITRAGLAIVCRALSASQKKRNRKHGAVRANLYLARGHLQEESV